MKRAGKAQRHRIREGMAWPVADKIRNRSARRQIFRQTLNQRGGEGRREIAAPPNLKCERLVQSVLASGAVWRGQARSTAKAMPSPPPMHSEATPRLAPRCSIAEISVTRTRAPEAPMG